MSYLKLLVNRRKEKDLLNKMLNGDYPHRILNICEIGGKGKSFLLKAFRQMCQQDRTPCSLIEFTSDQPIDAINCMREIVENIGEEEFPEFCKHDIEFHRQRTVVQIGGGTSDAEVSFSGDFDEAEVNTIAGRDNISTGDITVVTQELSHERREYIERALTKIFRNELLSLCEIRPVALIFDGYEHSTTPTADWIQKHILKLIHDGFLPKLLIVIAGRPEGTRPKFTPLHEWNNILINLTTLSEFGEQDVMSYFTEKRNIHLAQPHLEAYHRVCKNSPLIMGQIADMLEVEQWATI